jgi:DNA-binding MarR family transcriptional regulator
MTNHHVLNSQDIGMTENALRAVLAKTLAGSGLDYHRWVALKVLSDNSSPISTTDLTVRLKGGLKIDTATAVKALDDLKGRGILKEVEGMLSPTIDGRTLYQVLNDQVRETSRRIFAGIDGDELAVAYRVLSTLADRANALLAS